MGRQKRNKIRRKVRIRQSATLVHKNDATRVAKQDTAKAKKAPTRLSGDNAANFKIRIRRKRQ